MTYESQIRQVEVIVKHLGVAEAMKRICRPSRVWSDFQKIYVWALAQGIQE